MRYALIALLLLAGCTTIDSVRDEGARTTHALHQKPHDAAGCLARNIERHIPGIQSYVRSAGNGEMEVVVRNGPDWVFAVSQIAPRDIGSITQIWLSPHWFMGKAEFVPAMVKGC